MGIRIKKEKQQQQLKRKDGVRLVGMTCPFIDSPPRAAVSREVMPVKNGTDRSSWSKMSTTLVSFFALTVYLHH